VSQGALDEAEVDAGFEEMGGIRMSKGMDGHAELGDSGAAFGCAEGALDAGPTHRLRGGRALLLIPPGGRKEPGLVAMGSPVGAEQTQSIFGQRDIAVFGPLAPMDMNLEALAVDVGNRKGESFMEPEAQARDGGKVDLVVQGGGRLEEAPDFLDTADGGKAVFGLGANE
jgi:hypothetical protein